MWRLGLPKSWVARGYRGQFARVLKFCYLPLSLRSEEPVKGVCVGLLGASFLPPDAWVAENLRFCRYLDESKGGER